MHDMEPKKQTLMLQKYNLGLTKGILAFQEGLYHKITSSTEKR